ncbi:RNA-binding protein [Methanoplanus sp. FWC-SCC4]|uniref:RNA-binding protein n=1 Tax=Methanochimaera problematica TaxID=2609417 RepID=A0AA97I3R6_9EURY|nr:RNA-binding protein [Methanoplanus sp. FWC-SCC4]WOF15526.1 RNA-binding protein [Methanoplanus sp. FWC-SCC4]
MKLAGRINSIIGKHIIVVCCDPAQLPRIHTEVVDRRQKPVGKLVEVFGNINAPYATVYCKNTKNRITGEKIYTK